MDQILRLAERAESPFTGLSSSRCDRWVVLRLPPRAHSLPSFALLCVPGRSPCTLTSSWTCPAGDEMVRGVWVFILTLHSNLPLPFDPSRSLDTSGPLSPHQYNGVVTQILSEVVCESLSYGSTSWSLRRNSYFHLPNQTGLHSKRIRPRCGQDAFFQKGIKMTAYSF